MRTRVYNKSVFGKLRKSAGYESETLMCAFVSLHVYQFSSRSKDYSYVYTIRLCSTYLDHTWKTTLAGEQAPPAILDQKVQ